MALAVRRLDFLSSGISNSVTDRSIKRGVDITIPIAIRSEGQIVLLNGYSRAECRIRKYFDSAIPAYVPDVVFADKDKGLIHLVFSSVGTKQVDRGVYFYDIFFFTEDEEAVCFVEGHLEFSP